MRRCNNKVSRAPTDRCNGCGRQRQKSLLLQVTAIYGVKVNTRDNSRLECRFATQASANGTAVSRVTATKTAHYCMSNMCSSRAVGGRVSPAAASACVLPAVGSEDNLASNWRKAKPIAQQEL